jgi:hypothetical protein
MPSGDKPGGFFQPVCVEELSRGDSLDGFQLAFYLKTPAEHDGVFHQEARSPLRRTVSNAAKIARDTRDLQMDIYDHTDHSNRDGMFYSGSLKLRVDRVLVQVVST